MPEGAVYVGRPTRWGNPWRVVRTWRREWAVRDDNGSFLGTFDSEETAVRWAVRGYGLVVPDTPWIVSWLAPLRDATALACWCPLDQPCHADVLIELLDEAA